MLRAAFVTGEADSGEEEGEAPDGAGLLLLAGLSMIPRRRRGMSLGPLSANPANIPRLTGNAPLLTGNGAGTPLLTDGKVTPGQIFKTDAPHLNAELAARLATKEGGPDYAKRLDAISLLSENGNAGRGAAGVIDASAISGGLAARANVSPNKPVMPIDDRSTARVTKNTAENSYGRADKDQQAISKSVENVEIPKPPPSASLSNVEARRWYLDAEAKIPDLIDRTKPLEQQARQAFELRNQFRTQARNGMEWRIMLVQKPCLIQDQT